jgi:spore coat polysaccharide biosynthesis predicted glycosyltransferase SpsG
MKIKIAVFPGIYSDSGIGNVTRMLSLCDYLAEQISDVEIDFITNDRCRIEKVFDSQRFILFDAGDLTGTYDLALYDSIRYEEDILKLLKAHCRKIIAFDFFVYKSNLIDVIINLYNHFPGDTNLFRGHIFNGIEYAILRKSILEKTPGTDLSESQVKKVLITFGGEDPNRNTVSVLRQLSGLNLTGSVLVGKLNRAREEILNRYSDQFKIYDQVKNIEAFYDTHHIVFCGGGTTLLEALYFRKQVVAIPQNIFESDFIKFVGQKTKIFSLNDLHDLLECPPKLKNDSIVDGKGRERIRKIILETIH